MRDWREMQPDDFDRAVPVPMFHAEAPARPVPAVPDDYGTEALFGAPAAAQPRPARKSAPRPAADPTLF